MAEQVQAVLDQMVAPLRDLMERGIFSEVRIDYGEYPSCHDASSNTFSPQHLHLSSHSLKSK
jgi:hypothetical protein